MIVMNWKDTRVVFKPFICEDIQRPHGFASDRERWSAEANYLRAARIFNRISRPPQVFSKLGGVQSVNWAMEVGMAG
jgi:hypothetical protein